MNTWIIVTKDGFEENNQNRYLDFVHQIEKLGGLVEGRVTRDDLVQLYLVLHRLKRIA
jgi:hypothetical protein